MNQSNTTFNVAVVGGGLVGAAASLALAQFDAIQLHWISQDSLQPPTPEEGFSSRVIACTPGSKSFLESLGVWQRLSVERVQAYRHMHVWDGCGSAQIQFDATQIGVDSLGYIVENTQIQRSLYGQIQTRKNIRQWSNSRVDILELADDSCSLGLESGETIDCDLVVAADGTNSRLRELAGIHARHRNMNQYAIVALVQHRNAHRQTAWQAFAEGGPLAFLPLPDKSSGEHQSAVVWSMDTERANRIQGLQDSEFAGELERTIEAKLGAIEHVSQRQQFALQQVHAGRYCAAHFCLIGDAAHTVHPLAGQGANMGFRDVETLSGEIERSLKRGINPGHWSSLRRYERARKLHNLAILSAMEVFRYGFGNHSPALRWLRGMGFKGVDRTARLKQFFAHQAMS